MPSNNVAALPGSSLADYLVYHAVVELYSWEHSSKAGITIRLRLSEREELAAFEGERMVRRSRTGRPKAGESYRLTFSDHETGETVYEVDAWYKGAAWTMTMGATARFELADQADLEWFAQQNTGDVRDEGGQEFVVTVLQLDENGAPINQVLRRRVLDAARRHAELKGGPKSKHVARLCGTADFGAWFCMSYLQLAAPLDVDGIAARVRDICQIKSRAELDHNIAAWERWRAIESRFTRDTRGPL